MNRIATRKRKTGKGSKRKQPELQVQLVEAAINQIREANEAQSERLMAELVTLKDHVDHIRQMVERLKPASSRRGLFGRRRRIPVEVEPPQPTLPVQELLPLLPQLGKFIPQLKNQKVAETLKVLSNPAVVSMIQQLMVNNGGGSKARPVSRTAGRY
ncbi:MAG: hypothetical protein H0Z34_09990 [Brevibacillus sp.]|nr:hypothetical protein [Brevibacillus sp.]